MNEGCEAKRGLCYSCSIYLIESKCPEEPGLTIPFLIISDDADFHRVIRMVPGAFLCAGYQGYPEG
jgi:hypothetical protein